MAPDADFKGVTASSPKFVKAQISVEEAFQVFSKKKRFGLKKAKLKKVEPIYLPHYVFTLQLKLKSGSLRPALASADGILGTFALFEKQALDFEQSEAASIFRFHISEDRAREIALAEYRRLLLRFGLKNREVITIDGVKITEYIQYPYWIGYYQIGAKYDFRAIDGINAKLQGVKMRKVFITAFALDET